MLKYNLILCEIIHDNKEVCFHRLKYNYNQWGKVRIGNLSLVSLLIKSYWVEVQF